MRRIHILTWGIAALCSLCVSGMAFGAEFGTIAAVKDTVTASGENGQIISEITGTTDQEGKLALPLYEDAVLNDAKAAAGTLDGMPEEMANGENKYLVAQFTEPDSEVNVTLTWSQEKTYAMKNAKTSGTAPGSWKAIKYSMINTAPVEIGEYSLAYAVPDGYEMAGIAGYDPEEEYSIYTENGSKFGAYTFGSVPIGGESSMTINIQKAGGSMTLIMWAVTVIVSAFFLYKNRGMLAEAAEADKKRKAEKQGGAKA